MRELWSLGFGVAGSHDEPEDGGRVMCGSGESHGDWQLRGVTALAD